MAEGNGRNPVEALAEEFLARYRSGERPALSEYVGRRPDLEREIRDLFPALVMMEEAVPSGPTTDGARPPAGATAAPPLRRLGDYRILREIGRGGMGVVYEAEQEALGRHVALKLLPAEAASDGVRLERFRREAKAAARLHHTNIVPVFDVGECEGLHYYAMQYIPGQSLEEVLKDLRRLRKGASGKTAPQPLARTEAALSVQLASALLSGEFSLAGSNQTPRPEEDRPAASGQSTMSLSGVRDYYGSVARIGLQVAEALAYAHGQKVLHRDVKPANLLLDLQGTVWVTDFGLAKEEGVELTQTGDLVGTLRYMAPERFDGVSGISSDVYGLGVTLYELLALRPAFEESDRGRLIRLVMHEEPARPRRLDRRVPRDLETVVLKAMAKEPARRYATAAEMAEDLRRFLGDRPIRARRSSAWEQAWRWCRRNPAVAALAASVLLLLSVLTVGTMVKNAALATALKDSEEARGEAEEAKERANAELWNAYLHQARAWRTSGRRGQRFEGLATIREALKLPVPEGRSLVELRNEAIACLSLADVEVEQEIDCGGDGRWALAFDPSFDRYARTDEQGRVFVHRRSDRLRLLTLPSSGPVEGHHGLLFSPDGRFLCKLVGTYRNYSEVRLFRLEGRQAHQVFHESAPILFRSFRPDSRQLAILGADGTIVLRDTASGEEVRRFTSPGASEIRFHPSLPRLAIFALGSVRILDIDSGQTISEYATIRQWPGHTAWHPEGHTLAVRFDDQRIHLLDAATGKPRRRPLEGHNNGGVVFRFSHRGDLLASTDWGGILRLWDFPTGQLLLETEAHLAWVQFSPDDRLLAPAHRGDHFRVLRLARGAELRRLGRPPSPDRADHACKRVILSPEGRLLGLLLGVGVAIADLDRREEVAFFPSDRTHSLQPLHFNPDGSLLTTGDGGLLRWPRSAAGPAGRDLRFGPPARLATTTTLDQWGVSADGRAFLVPGYDRGAYFFRVGGETVTLGPQRDVRGCALSPDGRWAATASHGFGLGSIRVWDTSRPGESRELLARAGKVQFSPDGRWLKTWTNEGGGETRLWRVGTWEPGPRIARGFWGTFEPVGRLLALSETDGVVRLVDPESGQELARLSIPETTGLFPRCFTPDGRRLVALGSESGAVYVWDLALIRSQLRELGLDWGDEPLDAKERPTPEPIRVDLELGLLSDPEKWTALATFFPWLPEVYYQRAVAYLRHRRTNEALADLDRALTLGPRHADALYQRAQLRRQAGRHREEREDLERYLEVRPDHAEARARRAWLCAEAGLWGEAAADLKRLTEAEPANLSHWHFLAMAALADEDVMLYRETCDEVLRRLERADSPTSTKWLTWTVGLGSEAARDATPALPFALRDFRNHPRNYSVARAAGLLLLRAGRLDEARLCLDHAMTLQHDAPSAWLTLSLLYSRKGQAEPARRWHQRARDWLDDKPNPNWRQAPRLANSPWYERAALTHLAREAAAALPAGAAPR